MVLTIVVTIMAIGACNAVHFYSLRMLAHVFRDFPPPFRRPILVVSFAILAIHLIEVAIYAFAMFVLAKFDRGALAGTASGLIYDALDYFYFSIASYTTLGIGDIVPEGHLRIIVGIEALQGLILIAWSASFTFLVMERFWSRAHEDG